MTKELKTQELMRATGSPQWLIDYLIREGKIKVIRRGRGIGRVFSPESIEIITRYMAEHNIKVQHA